MAIWATRKRENIELKMTNDKASHGSRLYHFTGQANVKRLYDPGYKIIRLPAIVYRASGTFGLDTNESKSGSS